MRFDRFSRAVSGLIIGIGAATIVGCVNTPGPDQPIRTAPPMAHTQPRDPALDLLAYARGLREAAPEARARAVANARDRANDSADALSHARLALAYGTPGQRRYTPDEAARYAKRALAADDAHWSPAARQYLNDIARLYAQSARHVRAAPTTTAQRDPSTTDATSSRRATDERVRSLEKQLDEARRKLRELADIEERLNETGS